MSSPKYLNSAHLRLLGAASLLALGCSANVGEESTEVPAPVQGPAEEGSEKIAAKDDSLIVGPTLLGRWDFNEYGQRVEDTAGGDDNTLDNDGFLGRTPFAFYFDPNNPQRIPGGSPNDQDGVFLRFNLRPFDASQNVPPKHDFVSVGRFSPNFYRLQPQYVSVETWIRPAQTSSTSYVVSKGAHNNCNAGSYSIYISGGQVHFLVRVGGGVNDFRDVATGISVGYWQHVVGTFDGWNARIYVNGTLRNTVAVGGQYPMPVMYGLNKHNNLYFGAYNEDPTLVSTSCQLGYVGGMDDVRIWRNALSGTDVWRRYQGLELVNINDQDGDGVTDDHDICPDTPHGLQVGAMGCWIGRPDADGDGVPDGLDSCPGTIARWPDISLKGCGCGQIRLMVNATCPVVAPKCYRNHGEYVSCVDHRLDNLLESKIAFQACADQLNSEASHSSIGKPYGTLTCSY